jgi:uncharacterized Fe-S center protein
MRDVIFLKDESGFEGALRQELPKVFHKGERIAIKLHFGEPGNRTSLRPEFVKKVVAALKELGAEPFLFDSPVSYPGPRNTVEGYQKALIGMGFGEDKVGCPSIISDSMIIVRGKGMAYGVCKTLTEADGVLVLTHVKGHFCPGFGGAIKNLGMGALSRATKQAIHDGGKPEYVDGCTQCGSCERSCPLDNIRYEEGRPYFDKSWCCGCSDCVYACKFGAIKTKSGYGFDYLLSEGAGSALKNFKKGYFISDVRRITKDCDCFPDPGKPIIGDVGILMSDDIVAIDKAGMNLINKEADYDFFLKVHKKSPIVHICEAEKLGMGSSQYRLVEL